MDVRAIRSHFPMLSKTMHGHPLIYLDSAATAQKPQVVIDVIKNYYQEHYGTVHRAVYDLAAYATKNYEAARVKVRNFLHAASVEEIIFTRGTTDGINLVASSFGKAFLNEGDEVLISAMEHHANIVPWQMICAERRAILKVIPINDAGELLMDEFQKMLSAKVKIVAVAHISNVLGTLNPISEICSLAHKFGAKVVVDGAQAAPHVSIDVQALDVDFYTFPGHKLFGPTGVGILYGKKELLESMPPYQGGGDMIENVTFAKTTYNQLPLKFEAGTPMIAEVLGLGAAIDFVSDIGLQNIAKHEDDLLKYATEKMLEIPGLSIIGTAHHKSAIISFVVKGAHSLDIGTLLDLQGIAIRTGALCAQPTMQRFNIKALCRVSFAFYNTFEEIDRFTAVLSQALGQLR